jgi:hypothetical protein
VAQKRHNCGDFVNSRAGLFAAAGIRGRNIIAQKMYRRVELFHRGDAEAQRTTHYDFSVVLCASAVGSRDFSFVQKGRSERHDNCFSPAGEFSYRSGSPARRSASA